jgi:hypothetical protein
MTSPQSGQFEIKSQQQMFFKRSTLDRQVKRVATYQLQQTSLLDSRQGRQE